MREAFLLNAPCLKIGGKRSGSIITLWLLPIVLLVCPCAKPARYIIIALTALSLAGCAGSIERILADRTGELLYLHDSTKVAEKRGDTLTIGSFTVDDHLLPPATTAETTNMFIIPLLFINIWTIDYQGNLGFAQIRNDCKQFMRDSLIEELKRSGTFTYLEGSGGLELDVKVKTVTMSAPISKKGQFFFLWVAWSYGGWFSTGPVNVVVAADAVLRRDGKELFSKELRGANRTGILLDKNSQLADYTARMIEALSLAIKNLNENIVNEVNKTTADAGIRPRATEQSNSRLEQSLPAGCVHNC